MNISTEALPSMNASSAADRELRVEEGRVAQVEEHRAIEDARRVGPDPSMGGGVL